MQSLAHNDRSHYTWDGIVCLADKPGESGKACACLCTIAGLCIVLASVCVCVCVASLGGGECKCVLRFPPLSPLAAAAAAYLPKPEKQKKKEVVCRVVQRGSEGSMLPREGWVTPRGGLALHR